MNPQELTYQQLADENQQLKREIAQLKSEINKLASLVEQEKNEIVEHSKKLKDSVNYAQHIQTAIMPPIKTVKKLIPDSVIFYLPKDVVSGDFYFVEQAGDYIVFAAVDCTGHGVPGALMSVVGFNFLYQAVAERHIYKPSEILTFLDDGVNNTLRQTGNESGVKDGMDLGVCTLNTKTLELQYAGAYNPMYYVKKGELTEVKADKLPIGSNIDGVADTYTNHVIQMEKGDAVYLLTDGYADQFGGPNGKKFFYKPLRELLAMHHNKSMEQIHQILLDTFVDWKGNKDQIDDVLILGVRI